MSNAVGTTENLKVGQIVEVNLALCQLTYAQLDMFSLRTTKIRLGEIGDIKCRVWFKRGSRVYAIWVPKGAIR